MLVGIGALIFILWEPHLEGRNKHSTLFETYFHDPFLAYAYIASILFFVCLYQAFKLLGYIGQNKVSSPNSVRALKAIKYCSMGLVAFILGAEAYFFTIRRSKDDIAGGVMMGLFLISIFVIVSVTAAIFDKNLQSVLDAKSENNLTV